MIRLAVAALAVAATAVTLTGCVPLSEAHAADLADRIAIGMADDIAPAHYPEPLSGEHLAWSAIDAPRLPDDLDVEYSIDAYGWSGDSGDVEGARFSVRIDVHVLDIPSQGWSSGREEASATRCWRFIVRAIPEWQGAVERSGEDCPEGPLAHPQPDDLLEMPDDVEDRIRAVLGVATPDDAVRLLTEEFPDQGFSVVVEERDGELVVALGVPRARDCVVGVRHPNGSVEMIRDFTPELLLPGELGCDPMLFLGGLASD